MRSILSAPSPGSPSVPARPGRRPLPRRHRLAHPRNVRTHVATVLAVTALVVLSSCAESSTPSASGTSPSPTGASPSPSASGSASPTEGVSPSPSPSPSPEPEPLGRSVAHLRSTGDVRVDADLRLAFLDSFMAVWCDAPNDCAKAENSLQIMGEDLGVRGSHRTPTGLTVTIELNDEFLFTSGDPVTKGECTVRFTVSDERGFAGTIECRDITNGTGLWTLEASVQGTFVAAS